MKGTLVAVAGALTLAVLGVVGSALRVREHERAELDFEGPRTTLAEARTARGATSVSARLATVELRAGEHAVFEVCTSDALDQRWQGALDFVVFQLEPLKLLLRVALDDAHLAVVKRNRHGACLALGGGALEVSGQYAVDAVWPGRPAPTHVQQAPLRVRVLARQPLQPLDRGLVLLIAMAAVWLVIGLYLARPAPAGEAHASPSRWLPALALGMCAVLGGWLASAYLGPFGPTWGLIKTTLLATLQVSAALLLVRMGSAHTGLTPLSLHRPPRRPWLALAVAPLVGWLLTHAAVLALRLVPSTGESAIETFISWPSGMLAFASIGVLVPVCEEIFFRGFVYGRALAAGPGTAFALTVLSFTALHAAQTWGNWGSLLSIAITGTVLTTLRVVTGSTLVPALAHVVYNLSLSLRSM